MHTRMRLIPPLIIARTVLKIRLEPPRPDVVRVAMRSSDDGALFHTLHISLPLSSPGFTNYQLTNLPDSGGSSLAVFGSTRHEQVEERPAVVVVRGAHVAHRFSSRRSTTPASRSNDEVAPLPASAERPGVVPWPGARPGATRAGARRSRPRDAGFVGRG